MFGFGEQLEVDNIPGSVTKVKLNFEPGDNEGTIEFIMPATTIGGQDIIESMTYNVQVDSNAEIIKGNEVYGAEGISVTIPPLSDGIHTFTIWATLNGKAGPEIVVSKFIGNDTPKAPAQVILSESDMKLTATWEAVTEGVNEGYIDLADMSYDVYLNENFMTNTKELVWDYEVPADSELKGYNVTVIAVCKGLQSTGAVSNSVACGQPLNLDIYIAPTATESALMTYIGDGEAKWKYNDSYEPAVFSSGSHYSSAEPLDTWMFLPPINFPSAGESAKYQISFKTAVLWDFRDQDYFSVYIGKENKVDAMTKEITERQNPTIAWPEYAEYVNEFTVDEPGIYYIGVHCTSEPKQSGALLWDIAVKGLTVSVDSISSDTFRVETGNGYVNVYTSSDVMVEVFSIEGYKVAETKVNGTAKLSLPAGIYMLRAGNEVQKIRVR